MFTRLHCTMVAWAGCDPKATTTMTVVNGMTFPASGHKTAEDTLLQKLDEFHARTNDLSAACASALSEIKKTLQAKADEKAKPDEATEFEGTEVTIKFGEKANSTTLTDLPLAKKLMGTETFLKVAKIGVGDLKLEGTNIVIEFGAKANSTSLTDLPLAKKLMGTETFLKVAKIGVGDLKAHLVPEEPSQCTTAKRLGSCSMKAIGRLKK